MKNLSNISSEYVWWGIGFLFFSFSVTVYLWGVSVGVEEAERQCLDARRPLLDEVAQLTEARDALNIDLTMTKAQCAANCAINCEAVCAREVSRALEDANAWGCQ